MKKLLFISTLLLISLLQYSCSTEAVTNNAPTTNPVDVYVAGSKNGQACYWKNGQIVMLNSGNFDNSNVRKIIVSNNNVYAFGSGTITNLKSYSLFWKNGVLSNIETQLNNGNYPYFRIDDMEIYNNDEYFIGSYANLSGSEANIAYWKNGVRTIVGGGQTYYNPPKFKILNNNVFISVYINDNGFNGYFKNNIYYETPGLFVNNFALNGNDVFTYGDSSSDQGFYYNTNTNVNTFVNLSTGNDALTNLIFDNSNVYYSTYQKLFKNSTIIYQTPNISNNQILDFKILNDNVYKLINIGDINIIEQKIEINNIILLTATAGEYFNSLFIVQN